MRAFEERKTYYWRRGEVRVLRGRSVAKEIRVGPSAQSFVEVLCLGSQIWYEDLRSIVD
jgi:hypothetical protein